MERYHHYPPIRRLGRGTADSPACRAGDSGGSTRPGRQFSGTRKKAIRAAWDGETLGAVPRCPTNSLTPRSSNTQNAELLTRRLQVEVLPGRPITFHRGITVVHRPVKARGRGANPRDGANGVQVDISWRHSSRKRDPVNPEAGALPADSANFASFCSSRAEQPTDNRQITERYRAEGPISRLDSSRRRALV